jgi:hypothetical protein
MIMKKFTIDAFSLEDAKAQAAEMGLTVVRNVTPSWKKIGSPATSSKAFNDFAESVMKVNRLADAEGVGLIVVEESGSADTRERPYKYVNNVVEGRKHYTLVYEVRRKDDGTLIASAPRKDEAERLAKKAMTDVKATMECVAVKHADDGKGLAFTLEYTPSTNTKTGVYTVFGNERSF